MYSPGQGALRLARAMGLALTAYALSLVAHLVGGGHAPSAVGTAVLLFVTWWVSVVVTIRRLGRTTLIGFLAVSQVLLHGALGVASSAGACAHVVHSHAGHLANGTVTVCSSAVAPMHHQGPGWLMTLAHAVAALAMGLVLARGEAAVWFLAALVRPRLLRPVATPTPMRLRVAVVQVVRGAGDVVAPGGVGRRGPPARCALAVH